MYLLTHEYRKKEKIFKLYLALFVLFGVVNTILIFFDSGIGKSSGLQIAANLSGSAVICDFAWRRKGWAVYVMKFAVWTNMAGLTLVISGAFKSLINN
ncbi:hypothetical protein [Paenibacillus humicola]|uniref:hypothetical protein n=1 Tax=Paenibacillus humicola TaxID=3110540 RepID=UPI00237B661A|nr:hypothetical protein [Paenibacillus humicola]